MFARKPNRTLVSYILTQSALTLIVLAASFLLVELAAFHLGWTVPRLGLSLSLIALAQLPVAAAFARSETRSLTRGEGWVFGVFFVLVSFGFEAGVQLLSGRFLDFSQIRQLVPHSSMAEVMGLVLSVSLILVIVGAFVTRTLLNRSIKDRLAQRRQLTFGTLPRHKGRRQFDAAEHYRKELIGLNIMIFGLSLAVFGPDFLAILKLSIPLSIVFGVVCVANQLARAQGKGRFSNRCLAVSLQMLPLTVTCLFLLGLSEVYAAFAASTGAADVAVFAKALGLGLIGAPHAVVAMVTALGMIAALALAGNTLLLLLFARLVRPMIMRRRRPKVQELMERTRAPAPEAAVLVTASQMRAALASRSKRTQRPTDNPHSVKALLNAA